MYEFVNVATNSDFTINSNNGDISTARLLDFETRQSYTFTVTTTDGRNSPLLQSTIQVVVNVLVSSISTLKLLVS